MSPETNRRLDAYLEASPISLGGAVPLEEIALAEQSLGWKFDPDYREFIKRYGGAVIGSLPVLGLREATELMEKDETVINETARFRADRWPPTEDWLVISVDLAGNPIGLTKTGEVWISDHDAGEVIMIAPTFEAFVVQLLDESSSAT